MNLQRTSLLLLALGAASMAFAGAATRPSEPVSRRGDELATEVNQQWMLEGAKRYRINCGRCHQPPHQFSPRVMAMAVRHMRVRGMLTADDMKYVLYYMSH
jgi:cytochrome c5